MAVSAGAVGTAGITAVVGVFAMLVGAGMFMSGPLFTAETSSDSGFLGLGSSQSSSASVNLLPVLGLLVVIIGAVILLVGLKGMMHSFERGKERDEGTRHHLTVKRE